MSEIHQVAAGYAGSTVCLVAMAVYIAAIIKGKVHSNRVTWGVWIPVTAMLVVTYWQTNGLVASMWVPVVYFVGTVLTYIALRIFAEKGEWTWVERFGLVGAGIAIALWVAFHSGILGLTLTLIVDTIGSIVIVKTVYKDAKAEYLPAWIIGFAGNSVNLFAVERWDYANAAYPIYMVALTGTVTVLAGFPKFRFCHQSR